MAVYREGDEISSTPQELLDEGSLTEGATTEEMAIIEESPTHEANGDDLDDLFRAPNHEDPDMRIDDLVSVSEEDVFGEGGEDMSDLLDVSPEDVMGEDLGEPVPPPQTKRRLIRRTTKPYRKPQPPPLSIQGIR